MNNKIEKLKNIEFLRFVFIILIVFVHVENQLCLKFASDIFPSYFKSAGLGVEFFFIMSGFFFGLADLNKVSFITFVKKKILRLWPVVWFSVILYAILAHFIPLPYHRFINIYILLGINNVGFTTVYGNNSPAWFVSALFWTLLFYFFLRKHLSKDWMIFVSTMIMFGGFAFHIHSAGRPFVNVAYIFNRGLMRAFASIGLGYLLSIIYLKIKPTVPKYNNTMLVNLFYTISELYLFSFLMYYLSFQQIKSPDAYMIYILAFSGLFWLFILKRGYFSRLLNNRFSEILGKYSYSIFIMQTIVLDLSQFCLWMPHKEFIIRYPVLNFILPVVGSIILGIITYHFVEQPAAEFLRKKWFFKNKCKNTENQLPEPVLPVRGGSLWILNPI